MTTTAPPTTEATAASAADGRTLVPIDSITVGPRHRPVRPAKVAELKQSIAEVGLLNAITLTAERRLVAGANRLQACTELGMSSIPANITTLDEVHAEIAEIDENLIDSALTALEQGEHLVRREALLLSLGKRKTAGAQKARELGAEIKGETDFTTGDGVSTAELASAFGMSERSAQYRKQAATAIAPDVRDMIRTTVVADRTTDLLALARMPVPQQRKVGKMIADGTAKSVAAALRPRKPAAEKEEGDNGDVEVVLFTGMLHYRLPNPAMRARDDGKIKPREKLKVDRPITVTVPVDVLDDGAAGALRLAQAIGRGVYTEVTEKGWPAPQGHPAAALATSTLVISNDDDSE